MSTSAFPVQGYGQRLLNEISSPDIEGFSSFFATNGFVQQGEVWSFELSAESQPIPAWLAVTSN